MKRLLIVLLVLIMAFGHAISANISLETVGQNTAKVFIPKENMLVILRATADKRIAPQNNLNYNFSTEIDFKKEKYLTGEGNFVIHAGPGFGAVVKLNNLGIETKYTLDVYAIDKPVETKSAPIDKKKKKNPAPKVGARETVLYKFLNSINFATIATEPTLQAKKIAFSGVTDNSMRIFWNRGNGKFKMVLCKAGKEPDAPKDGIDYKAGEDISKNPCKIVGTETFVIFKGAPERSFCDVKGLQANTKYYFKVIEFNGEGMSANYLTKADTNNPRPKETIIAPPQMKPISELKKDSFIANWEVSKGATGYEIDVAEDETFSKTLELYTKNDVGEQTFADVLDLSAGKTYYVRVRAIGKGGASAYSKVVKVELPK
jgi:hypothetical protein